MFQGKKFVVMSLVVFSFAGLSHFSPVTKSAPSIEKQCIKLKFPIFEHFVVSKIPKSTKSNRRLIAFLY